MTLAHSPELGITHLPDHTELPESDGTFVLAKRAGSQNKNNNVLNKKGNAQNKNNNVLIDWQNAYARWELTLMKCDD